MTIHEKQRQYEGLIAETVLISGHNSEIIGGYMAKPLGPGPFPGVIVIHEGFGLVPHTKELVRKFAAADFIAVAPDLYWREGMVDPEDIRAIQQTMGGVPDSRVIGDLEGAVNFLRSMRTCNGELGCVGHCSGGRHTLLFACNTQSLSAAVDCFGGRIMSEDVTPVRPKAVIDMIPNLNCPLLGLFGEADANPSPEHVARLEAELKKHNKDYDFRSYPAPVGHGFFADYRPSYNQEAAVDGWERIFAFYDKHLR